MPKKLLVHYDEANRDSGRGDSLCVVRESGAPVLWGLRSRRIWSAGLLVHVGRDVSERVGLRGASQGARAG